MDRKTEEEDYILMHSTIKISVQPRDVDVRLSLARFLREKLHLTGTKISCGEERAAEDGERTDESLSV
jgi:aerobic-type carbon monoxide dehydrogenase small subunit (CoxS/CutS family)